MTTRTWASARRSSTRSSPSSSASRRARRAGGEGRAGRARPTKAGIEGRHEARSTFQGRAARSPTGGDAIVAVDGKPVAQLDDLAQPDRPRTSPATRCSSTVLQRPSATDRDRHAGAAARTAPLLTSDGPAASAARTGARAGAGAARARAAACSDRTPGARTSRELAAGGDVTFAIDEEAEELLESFLAERAPDVAFYSEDRGLVLPGRRRRHVLVVDPIDGTRPALAGFESCCVSVAAAPLRDGVTMGEVSVGCVVEIPSGAVFLAERGSGLVEGPPVRLSPQRAASTGCSGSTASAAGRCGPTVERARRPDRRRRRWAAAPSSWAPRAST